VFERVAEWVRMSVVPWLGYRYIRLLHATMRIEYRGAGALERARAGDGRYVLAFWHSRFVMMPYVYPDSRIAVLASRHRDAQRLGRILRRFGIRTVLGSSTRGGAEGLRAMMRAVRDGHDLGITPDGPRGPRRHAKPGVVAVARWTGLAIVPVTFSAAPAVRLRSWDRTLVPRPFARGLFVYGEPIRIPRDLDEDGVERHRRAIESALDRLTDEADRETGVGVEPARDPVEPAAVAEEDP